MSERGASKAAQGALFRTDGRGIERAAIPSYFGDAIPLPVRRFDPVTSHDAATKLAQTGALGRARQRTLDALRAWRGSTPPTAVELAAGDAEARYTYARRLPELARLGLVEVADKRPCSVTGNAAQTWRVVGDGTC